MVVWSGKSLRVRAYVYMDRDAPSSGRGPSTGTSNRTGRLVAPLLRLGVGEVLTGLGAPDGRGCRCDCGQRRVPQIAVVLLRRRGRQPGATSGSAANALGDLAEEQHNEGCRYALQPRRRRIASALSIEFKCLPMRARAYC